MIKELQKEGLWREEEIKRIIKEAEMKISPES
jgi:hypothetical protein